MVKGNLILAFCILIMLMLPAAMAATATISQSGADSGTVMKGEAFTLTVSGLSGSGTVSVNPPSGFEIPEADKVQSFSSGTTSVSFTTIVATEKLTSQTLTAQISVAGSPSTATTSSFNVVLQPSLSGTASPSSKETYGVSSFDLSVNVQNSGETTARGVTASISLPSGLTTSDSEEQSVGEISASSSSSVGWAITVGTPASSSNIVVTIDSSNADSETVTIPITYTSGGGSNPPGGSPGGSSPGGSSGGTTTVEYVIPATQLIEGYTKEIAQNDQLEFSIDSVTHHITLQSVTSTSATILVNSTPQTATLLVGQEKKFEITGDGFFDLSIKLNKVNVSANTADFTIKSIHEQMTAAEKAEQDAAKGLTGGEQPGADSDKTPRGGSEGTKPSTGFPIVWVILIIAIIIAVVVFFLVKRKKAEKSE